MSEDFRGYLSMAANVVLPVFSGNLDEPYAGVSFLNACNAHDQCYGMAEPKFSCDMEFQANMMAACSGNTPSVVAICSQFASAYHGFVGLTGQSAYDEATAARACAIWNFEMEANQCDE